MRPGAGQQVRVHVHWSFVLVLYLALHSYAESALPPGFQQEVVLNGRDQPVFLEVLPDGRMLLLHKLGLISIFDPSVQPALAQDYLQISDIETGGERGLTSLALDPNFAGNGYIYVYYTHASSSRNRISRFTHQGNTADLASETLIWEDNENWQSCCHFGGGIGFGPDGKLYLTTGEEFEGGQAQDLTRAGGKIIRINKDGSTPTDNPFVDGAGGNLDEIWAYGLRNPYRAHWDLPTGRFFIGDVGGNVQATAREEINIGIAGANYGWPDCEGQCPAFPGTEKPLFDYSHTAVTPNGGAVTAGFVYRSAANAVLPSSGLVAHFNADSGVTVTAGSVVLGWSDQSPQGNDMIAAGNPTLLTNALNGHQVVDFDGAGDKLERVGSLNGLAAGAADRTVFVVANYRSTGYGGFAYGRGVGPPPSCNEVFGLIVAPDGNLMVQGWCDDFGSGIAGTGQGWLVQSAVLSSGQLSHYQDGNLIDSRTHAYNTSLDAMVLGAELDSSPFMDMQVAEVLIYDRALSTTEQAQLQSYLQDKYFNNGGLNSVPFPAEYEGAFFLSDYVLSFIKYLVLNPDGSVASVNEFTTGVGAPVHIKQGLDGALYVVDYIGRVLRIKYNPGNQPPGVDSVLVSPLSGAPPLTVTVSAAATDPEGDNLTYHWFFGDGADSFGQTGSHTYTSSGSYAAYVEVSDGTNSVTSGIELITVGSPPSVTIDSPQDGLFFRAGDSINFSGTALDIDETIPANNYVWDVNFLHNAHAHPAVNQFVGKSGQLVVESSGHDWLDDTGYEFTLTVTDSDGISRSTAVNAFPEKVVLDFVTSPGGIPVFVDGVPQDAPFSYDTLIGFQHILATPDAYCLSGQLYNFAGWSDGGATTHQVTAPVTNQTYVASFTASGPCVPLPSAGLVTHLEADSGVSTSGSTVVDWIDRSAMANDLTASGNPQLINGALNGNPVIDFDGNGDKLERVVNLNGLPSGNADRSVYLVASYRSSGYGGFAWGHGVGPPHSCNEVFGLIVAPNGNLMAQGWCNDFDSGDSGTGQGWLIQSAIHSSSQLIHYRDGVQIDSRNHAYNTVNQNLVVGAELDSSPYLSMQVAAILIYDRALNGIEDRQVIDYLHAKYFNISNVNLAPVANDDTASVTDGSSVVIPVLVNDTDDSALDPASINVTSGPQNGVTSVDTSTGSITYAHSGSGPGIDSLTYTVNDFLGLPSNAATVDITINPGTVIDLASCGATDPTSCVISLFDGQNLSGVYSWFADSGFSDPLQVVSTANGLARISGESLGSVISDNEYRNYALILEYRWGDETFAPRVNNAKDAGIVVHSEGVEGSWAGRLMPGIELQIAEGSNGDLILLEGKDVAGNILPQSITSEIVQVPCTFQTWNCRGGYVWSAGGTPQIFDQALGHVHWNGWDPNWQDVIGFRGDTVLESPDGEWNQMMVVANGDQIITFFNGAKVNETSAVIPVDGKVQIQSEFAEYYVRRWELWPLDQIPTPIRPTSIVSESLADGLLGLFYEADIQTIGDPIISSWTVTAGTIPPGLTPDPSTGHMSGTPTASGLFEFTIEVTDDTGALDSQLISVLISDSSGDLPPVANDDGAVVVKGQGVNIPVLANDTDDVAIDPASVEVVANPTAGVVAINAASGEVTYTHNGISLGSDSFTYRVADSLGQFSPPATVAITVNEVNATVGIVAPADNSVVSSSNVQVLYQLGGSDYDHLHLSLDGNGHVTITNLTGSFIFSGVTDGPHTITATLVSTGHQPVNGPDSEDAVTFLVDTSSTGNQPPVANDDSATVVDGDSVIVQVLANDSDDSALDPATVFITRDPANGAITQNSADGSVTYIHDGSGPGTDSLLYQVNDDGGLTSNEATVAITIDAASSSIPDIGLVSHFEADSGVTLNGTTVTSWADQSVMANHLTASGNPQILSNALNGNPIIDFDGNGDKLERILNLNGLPAGNANRSMFLVASYRSTGYGGFAYGHGEGPPHSCNEVFGLIVAPNGNLMVQGWCDDFNSGDPGTGQGWLIQSAIHGSSQLTHFRDGIQIDIRSHAYNTVLQNMVVGAESDSIPYIDMQVAAIIVYDRELSLPEHQQVIDYLQLKYFGN
jgi:glucose/arabinose dehydrogenase